ncbi:MAG: transposase [Clostridia bacterium]|nr:transposase [Clostridia bacterium]
MSRQAREKCESNIYHVMLRGAGQQQIFEDTEDSERFLEILAECKQISEFALYAYCLMGNHVHLLIKEQHEPLEQIVKRIATRYVYWFNTKYERCGHLFQDRFRSEPVGDKQYFLTVLRYIHQNPVKAGICNVVEDYAYSSYREYVTSAKIIDTEFAFAHVSPEDFEQIHHLLEQTQCLDIENREGSPRVTDEQARRIIEMHTKCKNASDFQRLDVATRNKYLKLLKDKGLSIRQISRLTGISFGIVSRV